MNLAEPILTPDDERRWALWERHALVWSRSQAHARRVDVARRAIGTMHAACPSAYVAWSGGKDSTALAHLASSLGVVRAMSVKDDLDFPGEEDYIRRHATAWGIDVDIVRPAFSLQNWLRDNARECDAGGDFHGRASTFSEAAFYSLIRGYRDSRGTPGVYLGTRAEESHGRRMNVATRGLVYGKLDGETVCQPIARWAGVDVYAYLMSRGIDLLPIYRCVGMNESPDRVRKSWWLPGSSSRFGGMVWLRLYWPSLFARLREIMPSAGGYA